MTDTSVTEALARVTSAVVGVHDTTDLLASLLRDAVVALGGAAGGLVLTNGRGDLELLTATSHRAIEVELYQIQRDEGPCLEAARDGVVVSCFSADDLVRRWPDVGRAIVDAGFAAVHASPLRWGGQAFGALNVFHAGDLRVDDADRDLVGRAFADLASMVVVAPQDLDGAELRRRKQLVLAGRTAIEQAKGAIAFHDRVATDVAYERLVALARDRGLSLSEMARHVLEAAVGARADY